jgi:uncharacterized protein YbjT (DUF2867 family)
MIVMTAPTSQIGSKVVSTLMDMGAALRLIVRDPARLSSTIRGRVDIIEGSHGDASVLDRALEGADALFWLAPPAWKQTLEEAYIDFTRPAAARPGRSGPALSAPRSGWMTY